MMLPLLFIAMLFFLFSGSFALSIVTQERPERLWLPVLIFNALLLYVGLSLHRINGFFTGVYIVNMLALPLAAAIRLMQKKAILWANLFTPAIVFLLVGLCAAYWLNPCPYFTGWDTISHWGSYSKLLFEEGKISCEYPPGILLHASYPPGQAIFSFMVHKCFRGMPFQENIVLFAHDLVMWGVFARIFTSCNWRDWKKLFLLGIALLCIALPMVNYYVYATGYCDCALAMLFAVTMYDVVEIPFERPGRFFQLAVMLAFLFMIRNAGWGDAVGLLILYVIRLIPNFRQATNSPAKIGAVAAMFLLPAMVKFSWVWQLKFYHTVLRFGGDHITLSAMRDFVVNQTPDFLQSLKLFGTQLAGGYIETLLLILLALLLIARFCHDPAKIKSAKMLVVFNAVSFLLFCTTLFIYYLFEFQEKARFPSLCRYCSAFLYTPLVVAVLSLGDIPVKSPGESWKKTAAVFAFLLAIAVFLGYFLPAYNFQFDNCYQWRLENEKIGRFDDLLLAPGTRFTSIGVSGKGFKTLCFIYRMPHHYQKVAEVLDDRCLDPMPTEKIQRALLREQINFVYFTDPLPEFYRMHPTLFSSGRIDSLEDTLFQVDAEGKLRRVATPATQ